MSSEVDSAMQLVSHINMVVSVLEEVTPADLESAFNLGSASGYLSAIKNLFIDSANSGT